MVAPGRRPRKAATAAIAGLAALFAAPASAAPRRIVSMNVCADQLVIAIADRDQVAGLSAWARDPSLSYEAAQARAYPIAPRSGEAVLALRPDLVIGAPPRVAALLPPGTATLTLPPADDAPGIAAGIRAIAAATGHPARGEALVRRMAAALAAIRPAPARPRLVAAFYQRAGYLTGTGTLVDDMMRRAGLTNLAARLHRPVLAQVPLEAIAMARPDLLVGDAGTAGDHDRGTAMLRHPLLDRVVPETRRVAIPQPLTVCGGPFYPQAVAMLAAAARRLSRAPPGH